MDTYTIYCEWCKSHGQVPPSRSWWDAACAQSRRTIPIDDVQFDISTERREGWAYEI